MNIPTTVPYVYNPSHVCTRIVVFRLNFGIVSSAWRRLLDILAAAW